jgi:hypothetical protein
MACSCGETFTSHYYTLPRKGNHSNASQFLRQRGWTGSGRYALILLIAIVVIGILTPACGSGQPDLQPDQPSARKASFDRFPKRPRPGAFLP